MFWRRRGRSADDDFSVGDREEPRDDLIYYQMAGRKRRAHGSWYRGSNTNFHPMRASLAEPDSVAKYIGHGWFPEEPFIGKTHYITAFGSCFAAAVTRFLLDRGYRVFGGNLNLNSHVIRSGAGFVNTAALRQQFEWAFEGVHPRAESWYDFDGELAGSSDEVRHATRRIFEETDVFILTLGLSEVWFDRATNEVFWRGIPARVFDENRHGFRLMTVDENKKNLHRVCDLIRSFHQQADIILTLSPVPLAATFRPISCVTANSVSKAILRVALDEVMRERTSDPHLYYFPSYEIVTAFVEHPFGEDLRHPTQETVDFVMRTFERYYLLGERNNEK